MFSDNKLILKNWIDRDFEPTHTTIPAHGSNAISCLEFDGKYLASSSLDSSEINIYDIGIGKVLEVLKGHEGGVCTLKLIGNQLVSGSTDTTTRIWNIKKAKCTHIFRGHQSAIICMDIVEDEVTGERTIITGSKDNTIHVWKLPEESDLGDDFNDRDHMNKYHIVRLSNHTDTVKSVTGKGDLILSGSADTTVIVWYRNRAIKLPKFILRGHITGVHSVNFDAFRNRCISSSMDSTLLAWDLNTGQCVSVITGHCSIVTSAKLMQEDRLLVSSDLDGIIKLWDLETYTNLMTLDHRSTVQSLDMSSELLVSGGVGQVNVFILKNKGKLIRSELLNNPSQVWSVKITDDNSKVIVAYEKKFESFIEIIDFSKRCYEWDDFISF